MTTAQLSIFDASMVRNSDPETSIQAACVAKQNRQRGVARVLTALSELGLAADFQIATHAKMNGGSAAKRRLDAERAGDVRFADTYVLSPDGCECRCWELTAQGRLTLHELRGGM